MTRDDFIQLARDVLNPVVSAWGFGEIAQSENELRYQNEVFDLAVAYNTYTFELSVHLSPTENPSESYSMSELLRLWHHPSSSSYRDFASTDQRSLQRGLERLASLLSELAALGMAATANELTSLRKQKASLTQELQDKVACDHARAAAERAWQRHNYIEVVRALSAIEKFLSEAERKKLEFARKHSKWA